MNTRSEMQQLAGVDIVTFEPVGVWVDPQPVPYSLPYARPAIEGLFEAYSGPNPSNGVAWTDFEHYKRSMAAIQDSRYMLPWVPAWPNTGNRYWLGTFPTYFGWDQHFGLSRIYSTRPLFLPSGSGWFVPGPNNLGDLKQRALNSIMPGIKSEMSLLNSIIELKDFRGVVKKARSTVLRVRDLTAHLPRRFWARNVLADLKRGWLAYIAQIKKMSGSQRAALGARYAAENYLQWKFAVAPLIGDVLSAMRALSTLEKRLNRLITNEGRVRVGHWSTSFQLYPPEKREYTYSLGPPLYQYLSVDSWTKSEIGETVTQFHCEVRYNYNLTNYQREHARMLSYLDAFGLSLNPAVIWNAIPFTFLVDWVIGVSRFLDQFDVGNMDPKINILGALWSARHRRKITWSKIHESYEGVAFDKSISMPVIEEDAYMRHLFNPGISSFVTSGLSSSEVTLGAALVTAISHRKARRK
jgi:hypothetical protein